MHFRSLILVLLTACSAPSVATSTSQVQATSLPTFEWPTPAGWAKETIPFPLSFAPSLPYKGVEELRFAPGFFDPTSPTYFTYTFAFFVDDAPFTAEGFASDLNAYYTGLMAAVGNTTPDPSRHSASVTLDAEGRFHGKVTTFDAFNDGRTLALDLEGETYVCGSKRIVLASLSPRSAPSDPIWKEMANVRASFSCVGY